MAYGNLQQPANTSCPRIINVGWEVGEARNSFVADVFRLYPDAEDVFFLDDDVLVHPECLRQLRKANKPIVSGVYFLKEPCGEAIIFGKPGTGTIPYRPSTGLIGPPLVWGVPAGLLLVKTTVFRDMLDKLDLGIDSRGNPKWFETSGHGPGEIRRTEDIYFCQQAKKAGYDLWVDTDVYAFGWHYDANQHQGYPVEQWNQYIACKPVTWKTPIIEESIHALPCL